MKHLTLCAVFVAALASGCAPSPEDIRRQAIGKFQLGHPGEAEPLFQQVLARRPSDAISLFYMGRIAEARGFYERAIYYYQCCLDANAGFADARGHLDNVRRRAGTAGEKLMFIP